MNITIKVVKGDECIITVTPCTTILEVKQQIEDILNIPVIYQKIVLLGRPLIDENTISSYPTVKEGSKLNLIVKKPDALKDVIFRAFNKYFNESQSEKLTTSFLLEIDRKINQMNLEDIEQLATNLLQKET